MKKWVHQQHKINNRHQERHNKHQHRPVHRQFHQWNQYYRRLVHTWPILRAQQPHQRQAFTVSIKHTKNRQLPHDQFHRRHFQNIHRVLVKVIVIVMNLAQVEKLIAQNVTRCGRMRSIWLILIVSFYYRLANQFWIRVLSVLLLLLLFITWSSIEQYFRRIFNGFKSVAVVVDVVDVHNIPVFIFFSVYFFSSFRFTIHFRFRFISLFFRSFPFSISWLISFSLLSQRHFACYSIQ